MTDQELITFQNDMRTKTGFDLVTQLQSYQFLGNNEHKLNAFANRAEDLVLTRIGRFNKSFRMEEASQYQKDIVWKVILEQAYYQIMTGDQTAVSGIDYASNSVIPLDEIEKRWFSPHAHNILLNAGLLYTGIRRRRSDSRVV